MLWLVSWYNFRRRWEVHLYYWYHSCWYRLKNGAGERVACMYFGLMQDSLYGFANQMTERNMSLAIFIVFIRGIIEMLRLKRLELLSLDRGCLCKFVFLQMRAKKWESRRFVSFIVIYNECGWWIVKFLINV